MTCYSSQCRDSLCVCYLNKSLLTTSLASEATMVVSLFIATNFYDYRSTLFKSGMVSIGKMWILF